MCRAGGRRCQGSTTSSRDTQTLRKRVSRANQALRGARKTGDQDAIAQAQQRLDAANAALASHKENTVTSDSQHAANAESARQDRDVTGEPPAEHTERTPYDDGQYRRTVTNIAAGGSHVGVQAGVVFGGVHVDGVRVANGTSAQQGDVTNPRVQGGSPHDIDVVNIAPAGSHVDVQAGVIFGNNGTGGWGAGPGHAGSGVDDVGRQVTQAQERFARRKARRMRDKTGQDGDVTPTQTTFRTSGSGTVTNIAHGEVHGIQTDVVNGPLHFGQGGFSIGTPDNDHR